MRGNGDFSCVYPYDIFVGRRAGRYDFDMAIRFARMSLWQIVRHFRCEMRDMRVRHAREREALDAWIIECEHYLSGVDR